MAGKEGASIRRLEVVGTLVVVISLGIFAASRDDTGAASSAGSAPAVASVETTSYVDLTTDDISAAITRVQNFQAESGESFGEIVNKAKLEAAFIPGEWGAGRQADGRVTVSLPWRFRAEDTEDDEITLWWQLKGGTVEVSSAYAKPMALGSRAFVAYMTSTEDAERPTKSQKRFARDLSNFNFVKLRYGQLGDLLSGAGCRLTKDAIYFLEFAEKSEKIKEGYHFSVSVNCKNAPPYFAEEGEISFYRPVRGEWQPVTFFAKRISKYPPGHWFDAVELDEVRAAALAADAVARMKAAGRVE